MIFRRLANAILLSTVLQIGWPGAGGLAQEVPAISKVSDLQLTPDARPVISIVSETAIAGLATPNVPASSAPVSVLNVRNEERSWSSDGQVRYAAGLSFRSARLADEPMVSTSAYTIMIMEAREATTIDNVRSLNDYFERKIGRPASVENVRAIDMAIPEQPVQALVGFEDCERVLRGIDIEVRPQLSLFSIPLSPEHKGSDSGVYGYSKKGQKGDPVFWLAEISLLILAALAFYFGLQRLNVVGFFLTFTGYVLIALATFLFGMAMMDHSFSSNFGNAACGSLICGVLLSVIGALSTRAYFLDLVLSSRPRWIRIRTIFYCLVGALLVVQGTSLMLCGELLTPNLFVKYGGYPSPLLRGIHSNSYEKPLNSDRSRPMLFKANCSIVKSPDKDRNHFGLNILTTRVTPARMTAVAIMEYSRRCNDRPSISYDYGTHGASQIGEVAGVAAENIPDSCSTFWPRNRVEAAAFALLIVSVIGGLSVAAFSIFAIYEYRRGRQLR
ncbi:hypothetical protein ACVIGB_000037 [Bradyrhizobium sp. USDA 4341]